MVHAGDRTRALTGIARRSALYGSASEFHSLICQLLRDFHFMALSPLLHDLSLCFTDLSDGVEDITSAPRLG